MCTDRHGIFNYLRISSPALFSFPPFPLFAIHSVVFLPFFTALPRPSIPSSFAHLPRSVAIGFRHIRRHKSARDFSRVALRPLSIVARADAIAPVAQLPHNHVRKVPYGNVHQPVPNKKWLTVLSSIRHFLSLSIFVSLCFLVARQEQTFKRHSIWSPRGTPGNLLAQFDA